MKTQKNRARTTYQMLSIRLNLLKADCLQALNHARAVEFSQDRQAIRQAYRQYGLIREFLSDLMMELPDDLSVSDPLVTETMETLNAMSRAFKTLRQS
jgi:hypothetical protein